MNLAPAGQRCHTVHIIAKRTSLLNQLRESTSIVPLGSDSCIRNPVAPNANRSPSTFPSTYSSPSTYTSSSGPRFTASSSSVAPVSMVTPSPVSSSSSSFYISFPDYSSAPN